MSNNHLSYINAKGEEVPRVHHILSVIGISQLLIWSNYIGLQGIKYKHELERTANVGSLFHEVIECALKGETVKIDYKKYKIYDSKSQREFKNCLDSFSSWYQVNHEFFLVSEYDIRLVGDEFGGTLDVILQGLKNKKHKIICDFKTSSLFTLAHFLQLAAYVLLHEENRPKETIEGVLILRVDKKAGGIGRSRFYTREEIEPFILIFKLLVQVYKATSQGETYIKSNKRTLEKWAKDKI